MIKINTTLSNVTSANFLIGNFQNPETTIPITNIQTFLTNSVNKQKAYLQSTIMASITPERIDISEIETSSQIIGANGLTFTVQFTTMNIFKSNYQIWVQLPFWNPRSLTPLHMITNVNPYCQGIQTLQNSLTCIYDTSQRVLIISNAIAADLPAHTPITFSVDSFQNPYNGIPKSGFRIATMESTGVGMIDQSDILSINVTQFTALNGPTVSRADLITTVGELSSLVFGLQLNLPVDPDCRIRIAFPSDQPITNDLISSSGTNLFTGAFGIAGLDYSLNYVEIAGCMKYQESTTANQISTLTLSKIVNIGWVKDTLPFGFQMFAMYNGSMYNIAEIQLPSMIVNSATMLTQGSITSLSVNAQDSSFAGQFTRYLMTLQPVHFIPSLNKVIVQFPTSSNLIILASSTVGSCEISYVSGGASTASQCYTDQSINGLVLINAFGDTGQFLKDGNPFTFLFSSGGTNPPTVCGTMQFSVSTFATINGVDYPIDSQAFYSVSDFPPKLEIFKLKASILNAQISLLSSYIASYKPVTYTFIITPLMIVPVGSILQIIMPPTIILPLDVTQILCNATINDYIYYEFVTASQLYPLTLKLLSVFGTSAYTQVGASFNLQCEGIWNPRTLESSDSFTIQITDPLNCPLESIQSGLTVAMAVLPTFESVNASTDNEINGEYSTMQIEVASKILLYNNDSLYITFPPQIKLPSNPVCVAGNLLKIVACTSPSQNVLQAQFQFRAPVLTDYFKFSFKIQDVRNPPDTNTTTPFFNIGAMNEYGHTIALFRNQGPTIQNHKPSYTQGTLFQLDTTLGAITSYQINYVTVNKMAAGSTFLIQYPSTVTVPNDLTVHSVTIGSTVYEMKSAVYPKARSLKLYFGLDLISVPEGSNLKLTIGPITNPETPLSVGTFSLTSFTDVNQIYLIDRIEGNLVPQYQCEYPCATCPSQAYRSICLSCFTTEVQKYLLIQTCVAICPDGTQANELYLCVEPTIFFEARLLNISSYQAEQQPVVYSLQILPQKVIPAGSVIKVIFPPEISLAEGATNILCDTFAQRSPSQIFKNSGVVKLDSLVPPLVLNIEGIFPSKDIFDKGTKITINCGQLKNPQLLTSTSSFKVIISNPSATTPGVVTTGMQVQMTTLASIMQFKMEPIHKVTGTVSEYNFTLISGMPLYQGSYIELTLPVQLTSPEVVLCSIASPLLYSISCSQHIDCIIKYTDIAEDFTSVPNGKVRAEFQFVTAPLPANTSISFIMQNIGNPSNTVPVNVEGASLYYANGSLIPQHSSDIPSFAMQYAADVVSRSLTLDTYQKGEMTGVTITYTALNFMSQNSIILVTYPISAGFQASVDISCAVNVNGIPCGHICKIDRKKREITFQISSPSNVKPINAGIAAGSIISLVVKDFMNNAKIIGISKDSFTLKSFTDNTRIFAIDQINTGILLLFSCNSGFYYDATSLLCTACILPCLTCNLSGNKCTSCNPIAYLYEDQCYEEMASC